MRIRSFLRLVFKSSGPKRAEAEALDEQRRLISSSLTISRYRQKEAVTKLLDETIQAIERSRRME